METLNVVLFRLMMVLTPTDGPSVGLFDTVIDTLKKWGNALKEAVIEGLKWFWCKLLLTGLQALDWLASLIDFAVPDYVGESMMGVAGLVPYANAWVPLGFFAQLVVLWGTIKVGVISYRFAKSWLPGLGS